MLDQYNVDLFEIHTISLFIHQSVYIRVTDEYVSCLTNPVLYASKYMRRNCVVKHTDYIASLYPSGSKSKLPIPSIEQLMIMGESHIPHKPSHRML